MIWPSAGTILFDLLSDGQSLKWIKMKLSSITNAIWSFQGCIMVQVVAGKAVACLFCGCTIPESPFFGVFCQVRTHQGVFGEFLVSRYLALFQTFGLLLFPSILAGEKHPILTNIFEFLCLMISSHFSFRSHHFCQMHFSGLNLQPESSSLASFENAKIKIIFPMGLRNSAFRAETLRGRFRHTKQSETRRTYSYAKVCLTDVGGLV